MMDKYHSTKSSLNSLAVFEKTGFLWTDRWMTHDRVTTVRSSAVHYHKSGSF